MGLQEIDKIEKRIDLTEASAIEVSDNAGGVLFQRMGDLMQFAKLMAVSKQAVPQHCRNEPGICLAICVQATEWKFSPYAVANKSYVVNDRVAYESQLIHAVVEARAPLQNRLRCSYEGEGVEMRCTVTGLLKGEKEPHEYTSPRIKDLKVKNSPLWTSDPQQQLFYFASRSWARKWTPDVLLGIYSSDELADEQMRDVTPQKPDVGERLKGSKGRRGFSHEGVTQALEHKSESETVAVNAEQQPAKTQTIAAADVEPPIARGERLLAVCKSKPEIVDLRSTILDELTDKAQIKHWNSLCDARAAELKD